MASSEDLTTRTEAKQPHMLNEQSTQNEYEKVVPVTDQADGEDSKPEKEASMGNYMV